jgi:hypothetical protein
MILTFLAFLGFPAAVPGGSLPLETTRSMKPEAAPKVASDCSKTCKKNNLYAAGVNLLPGGEVLSDTAIMLGLF